MSVKTYVLLDALNSDAPIYQRVVGDQRVKLQKMPFYAVYLRVTFQDKNGVSQTIRYKENAQVKEGNGHRSVLDQREQIDKLKIDANEHFTQNERKDRVFRNGILVTNKGILQDYLDIYPGNEKFEGFCDDIKTPVYKELDKGAESKIKNNDIRLRVLAANKIINLDLDEAKSMLIRLNGSFFETPNDVEECQNLLMEFADDAEEPGLKAILKEDEEMTIDEKTTVLIGKLLSAGVLSFDSIEGKVSKKLNTGEWVELRDFSPEYSLEERKRMFSNFLNTNDGKPLKEDLENDLSDLSDDEEENNEVVTKKRMGRPPKNRF